MIGFLNKMKKVGYKGFTLVELMIVVAIIGILAAIAIPQFVTYRIRANNTTAAAFNKVAVSSLAALNSDLASYGITDDALDLANAIGGSGAGAELLGSTAAIPASTATTAGAMITGGNATSRISAVGFTVPNNCEIQVSTEITDTNNDTYHVLTRNTGGNRCFASEAEISDVMYYVQNPLWRGDVGLTTTPIGPVLVVPAVTTGLDFDPVGNNVGFPSSGAPTPNWKMLE